MSQHATPQTIGRRAFVVVLQRAKDAGALTEAARLSGGRVRGSGTVPPWIDPADIEQLVAAGFLTPGKDGALIRTVPSRFEDNGVSANDRQTA